MPLPPPNLNDPEALRAYRLELRRVALLPRRLGVALAVVGGLLSFQREQLALPDAVPLGLLLLGVIGMAIGITQRTRYHRRRMAGEDPG